MTDHASFLQAILSDPDSDNPRLVYADWLEENGDARAEEIRGNETPEQRDYFRCRFSRATWDDMLNGDIDALRAVHQAKVSAGFDLMLPFINSLWDDRAELRQQSPFKMTYRLGYIERISGSVSDWQRVGWGLLKEHPIRDVVLSSEASLGQARHSQPEVPQHLTEYADRLRTEIQERQQRAFYQSTLHLRDELRRVEEAISQIVAMHMPSVTFERAGRGITNAGLQWLNENAPSVGRLHLRKQSDSWAAHWLRVEDKEPGELGKHEGIQRMASLDTGVEWLAMRFSSREAMLSGLPQFLEECLKRQRTQTTIADYLRRETEETLLRRTTHADRV